MVYIAEVKSSPDSYLFYNTLVIGGGAAGFFCALNLAKNNPRQRVAILERGKSVLEKVRISGGGRCNVTHAQFIPQELIYNYPRGAKELLGPFHKFMTGNTIAWFEDRGIPLKIEEDGRMFPTSDSSQTIVDCFLEEAQKYGVAIIKERAVRDFAFAKAESERSGLWTVTTSKGVYTCNHLVVTTGSNPKIWKVLEKLGHTITPAVPSLFTFNIKDSRIEGLMGLSIEAAVKVMGLPLESEGPLLITHWGMSGPGILKLSAWGARELNERGYNFKIQVNWLLDTTQESALEELLDLKNKNGKQSPYSYTQFELPKRFWKKLLAASQIETHTKWADLSKGQLVKLAQELTQGVYQVKGKSTFKEEFVTAGGVDLKEINFKTFESKLFSGLYMAGEVLNIDAITGGFNFQNAWTGGYHVAQAISDKEIV